LSKINVEQLFILLCADVKHLITFEVETQNKGNSFIHFSANKLKDQKKYLIKYSKDAGNANIKDVEELLEYVVIFCHELTHCLNDHSTFQAGSNKEVMAMETHADFQGARIATALYTYGKNLRKILREDFKYADKLKKDKTTFCKLMGRVFTKLYYDFYKDGDTTKYLEPFERVGMNIAGVASFFYRSPQFLQVRGEYVGMHLKMITSLDNEIVEAYQNKSSLKGFQIIDEVVAVHRKIQGNRPKITEIRSPIFEPIFGTNYHKNDKYRLIQKKDMKDEIMEYAKNNNLDFIKDDIFKEK